MLRTLSIAVSAAALLLGAAEWGLAQGVPGGGFGTSGFGGSGSGAGGFGTSGVGSFGSAFGRGGTSGSAFGVGGSGFGNSAFGGSGLGSQGLGGQGFGGGIYGFGQGGQSFVGRDSGDMQALYSNLGRGANQFFQQLDRSLDRAGRRGRRNRQTDVADETARTRVRVQLRVAFDEMPLPRVSPGEIQRRLETALVDLADPRLGSPEVLVQGGVVTLRGTASSESRRLVIEKLAALEPGVREVRNQMTVAPNKSETILPESAE